MPHQLDVRLLGHLEPSFASKNGSTDPGSPALGYPQNGRGRCASARCELRDARLASRPYGTRRLRVTRT